MLVEVLRDWVIELTEADVTGVNIEGREAFIHENMGVPDETMEELLGKTSAVVININLLRDMNMYKI